MTSIAFTIVITTHNRLNLLKRAINSALKQTVPCEVVVVDNASTDGTQDYVQSLGNQVTYHRNATNTDHSGAVNAGVDVATGDWIKLVDDDDYLAPNCIEEMSKAIELHPNSVICSCQAAQVDADEVELSRTPSTGPGNVFYIPQEDIHYGMLLEVVPFGRPIQVAVQREAFLKTGGWDMDMTTSCDDIDSWVRIAQHGDALFINKCLTYRTMWAGGYEQKTVLLQRLENNLLIKERIYERIHDKYRSNLPSLETIRQYLHLHWMIVALKQKRFSTAAELAFPAVFAPPAWKLLQQAINFRKQKAPEPISKLVLVE